MSVLKDNHWYTVETIVFTLREKRHVDILFSFIIFFKMNSLQYLCVTFSSDFFSFLKFILLSYTAFQLHFPFHTPASRPHLILPQIHYSSFYLGLPAQALKTRFMPSLIVIYQDRGIFLEIVTVDSMGGDSISQCTL